MSTKVMTAYDELMAKGMQKGKEQGFAEGVKRTVVQTILNAYDAGINLPTIRTITGESEEKINDILKQHHRVS